MDRRKRKTRTAIFSAFIALLSEKHLEKITVGDVIARADVGRATFYAHFETREQLLQELCRELFDHLFEREQGVDRPEGIFYCQDSDFVFLHLLRHIHRNDNHLLDLLSGENRRLFLDYFKKELYTLVQRNLEQFPRQYPDLPEDFRICHICAAFVETVRWWIDHGLKDSPERMAAYFRMAVGFPFDKSPKP